MTSISAERANLAKVGLKLRRREAWGARFNYNNSRPVTEPADHVFCHISVTNPGSYNSNDAHVRAIENIGIARFGNTGFSYNRAITQDGTAYEGQPVGRRGAHTVNDKRLSSCTTSGCPGRGAGLYAPSYNLNVNARSYVIAQNVNDTVSDRQLDAVARCIAADMLAGHVKRSARIHGHRCVSWKDCPGGRMWARMSELKRLVDGYLKAGRVDGGSTVPPHQEDDVTAKENWDYRGREYVNKNPSRKDNQLARVHQYTHAVYHNVRTWVWRWRGLDYVNKKPASKDHQLAKSHENTHKLRGWLGSNVWRRDVLGKSIWRFVNEYSGKTLDFLMRRIWQALYDTLKSPFTGNEVQPRTLWRQTAVAVKELQDGQAAILQRLSDMSGSTVEVRPLAPSSAMAVDALDAPADDQDVEAAGEVAPDDVDEIQDVTSDDGDVLPEDDE